MITTTMILYGLKLFLVSWVLSSWAGTLINDDIDPKKSSHPIIRLAYIIPQYVLSCPKCMSFWLVLILTFNFYWAAGISFLIMWVDKLSQSIKTNLL